MRSALTARLFIVVALEFLAVGAIVTPRRPVFTILGIAFFVIGFAARQRGRGGRADTKHPRT